MAERVDEISVNFYVETTSRASYFLKMSLKNRSFVKAVVLMKSNYPTHLSYNGDFFINIEKNSNDQFFSYCHQISSR